jgi:hypothetical protein
MNRHQIEKIILFILNIEQKHKQPHDITLQNQRSKEIFEQMRYQREHLNITTTNTRELDKGRGARTISEKTLPTLVPLVTCFNCMLVEKTGQNEQNQLEKGAQKINCINLSGKSILIIQIEKEVYFMDILKLKKYRCY